MYPPTQIITEGRLLLEFTFDDLMRIRSWHFAIRQHRELIPRSVIGMQVGAGLVAVWRSRALLVNLLMLCLCFVCSGLCFCCFKVCLSHCLFVSVHFSVCVCVCV